MNDELYARVTRIFERIDGGSTDTYENLIDQALEDGELSDEEWAKYEYEIACMFDNRWFYCTQCGWTLPVDAQGEDTEGGEMCCADCN